MLTTTHPFASPAGWLARVRSSRWRALPVLMAGTFMIVLDFFIVNVALPSMQSRLHAGPGTVEWVVAGYGLTFSTFLITAGRLGDRIGRRRLFAIGMAVFTVASAACGLAPDAPFLVAARCAQGIGAALIGPSILAIIGVTYTGSDRVRAISVYGTVMGLAAVSGQLIGGLLIQANPAGLGWRAVFLINLPVAAAALALTSRLVPESRAGSAGKLDLTGTALATLGLTAVVLPLVEGRQYGWPAWTIACLILSPFLLGAFVWSQRRRTRLGVTPLLDIGMFKERAFAAGLLTQLGLWCGQASFFLVLALYLQEGRGLDPLDAGLVFTILAATYLVASLRAPALTIRFGRTIVGVGAITLAAGHGLLVLAVQTYGTKGSLAALVPGLLLVGAGMGLCITPLTTVVLSSSSPERAGSVSGAMSTVQQVGNALGVAVTGIIFFDGLSHGYERAFSWSLVELAALLVGVALLSRLLPKVVAGGGAAGTTAGAAKTVGSVTDGSAVSEAMISKGSPADVSESLRGLIGLPVSAASRSLIGIVTLGMPGWDLALAGVADSVSSSVMALAARPCHISAVGRYGRFWWLELMSDGDQPGRVTMLGSAVRVLPAGGGEGGTWLTPLGTRHGYSLA
jgi:EmrB/QacA subfamily drug resistance transporter